jgi:hypothetical protein
MVWAIFIMVLFFASVIAAGVLGEVLPQHKDAFTRAVTGCRTAICFVVLIPWLILAVVGGSACALGT